MNDLRSSKQDERMEEMLEMLESMEKELTQKDSIIRQKDSEIRTLQEQLNESLNLCEKLNSENKAENVQALKNELKQTKELLQSEKEKKKLMLADNRIFDLGVDDMKAFDEFIAELGDDLDVPGFDDELLRSLVANEAEIDEMMSSYGLITEEKKEEIAGAAETYRKAEAERVAQPEPASGAGTGSTETAQPVGKYVVCPKCGEKIWL